MTEKNHEYYVSLEVAQLLKKAGFDWKQYSFYNSKGILINGTFAANWNDKIWDIDGNKVSAPTLDVAQRWFREVRNFDVLILFQWRGDRSIAYKYEIRLEGRPYALQLLLFNTYEEALEAGIKKALEIFLEEGE